MRFQQFLSRFGFVKVGSQQMVAGFQEGTTTLSTAAQEKIDSMLDDYKQVIAIIQQFGIEVESFKITTGVGIPQVVTRLNGSIAELESSEIQTVIDDNSDNKILGLILSPLIKIKDFQEQSLSELDRITIDVSLGFPPKVTINLS